MSERPGRLPGELTHWVLVALVYEACPLPPALHEQPPVLVLKELPGVPEQSCDGNAVLL